MTGFSREELIGRLPPYPYHPPDQRARLHAAFVEFLEAGRRGDIEVVFQRRDGERFPVVISASPLHDERGDLIGGVRVIKDLTVRAGIESALRESEERYRSLIAAMSDGVVVMAADCTIMSCNPAVERILGITAGEVAARSPSDPRWHATRADGTFFPAAERPPMFTLRTGEPQRGVVVGIHTPDRGRIWLSLSTIPLGGRPPSAVLSCFTDITDRVEAEREQTALRHVATRVASGLPPDRVFQLVAVEAARLLGVELAGVVRIDEVSEQGVVVGAWGEPGLPLPAAGTEVDLRLTTASGIAAQTGRSARVESYDTLSGDLGQSVRAAGVRAGVAAPVRVEGRLWGVVSAATTRTEPLPPEAEQRLEHFAELVALAISAADARERLAALALIDGVTGLWNHRAFVERIAPEFDRARRHGHSLALTMLDIDQFRVVNDTHGHPAGDQVLEEVARRLRDLARSGDVLARIGGDEFAWILPGSDLVGARDAADRARRVVAEAPFPGVGNLSLSAGACDIAAAESSADLVRRAEAALYRAKAEGRDCTVLDGAAPRATARG